MEHLLELAVSGLKELLFTTEGAEDKEDYM